jgi:rhamnosyltransferase
MNISPAVVVVLYKEEPLSFIYEMGDVPVVIVDNTPNRNLRIKGTNIFYIPLLYNSGIAHALNVGCEKAKALGSNWVLTLDQDSIIPDGILLKFKDFLNECHEKVGLLCPQLNMYDGEKKQYSASYEVINEALSSGSFISIEAYNKTGGFLEKLFIDEVDFEFCRHIRTLGYKVIQLNSVVMQHHLGNTIEFKMFGKHLFYVTNHNYVRHYYMQRNGLYVSDMYRGLLPEIPKGSFMSYKPFFKIILFEKDKIKKIRARYRGYCDYKNNKFGEFTGL